MSYRNNLGIFQESSQEMMASLTMAPISGYFKVPGRAEEFCGDGSEQGFLGGPAVESVTVDVFATKCFPGSCQEITVTLLMIIKGTLLESGKRCSVPQAPYRLPDLQILESVGFLTFVLPWWVFFFLLRLLSYVFPT